MSGTRWLLALGVCALLLLVPIAMYCGLRGDPAADRRAPSRTTPRVTDPDPDDGPEPTGDETEETASDEPEDEPAVEGVRTLLGTVADDRGDPVEEAEVMIDGFGRLRDFTTADGLYHLSAVPVAPVSLVVRAPGFAEHRSAVGQGSPMREERHDVTLEQGKSAAGTVLDPEGKPLQGARVGCADVKDDALSAITDRRGRFELPPRAVGCDAVARHDRHGDSPRVALAAGARNLIALSEMGSIAGVVVDDRGRGVPSFVLALESFQPTSGGMGRRSYRQTFSHPEGRFTVNGLAAGTYVFSIVVGGRAPVPTRAIVVKAGERVGGVRLVAR